MAIDTDLTFTCVVDNGNPDPFNRPLPKAKKEDIFDFLFGDFYKVDPPTYTAPIPANDKQPINRRKYYIGQSLVRHYPDGGRIEVKVKEIHNDHLVVVGCKWFKMRFIDVDQVARFDKEELSFYEPLGSPEPQKQIRLDLLKHSLETLNLIKKDARELRDSLFPVGQKVRLDVEGKPRKYGRVRLSNNNPHLLNVVDLSNNYNGLWLTSHCTPID